MIEIVEGAEKSVEGGGVKETVKMKDTFVDMVKTKVGRKKNCVSFGWSEYWMERQRRLRHEYVLNFL